MDSPARIGFFPFFHNLAESVRLARVAEEYRSMGGEAVFFSHGGAYEYLAEEIGCGVVRVDPIYTEAQVDELMKYDRLEKFGDPFSEDWLIEHVEHEEQAYSEARIGVLVTGSNFPSILSARKAGIPLVWIIPGTSLPPYFEKGLGTFPDILESRLTKLVPEVLKSWFINWYMLRTKQAIDVFNSVARRYGLPEFERSLDMLIGDYTLVSDLQEFLGVEETAEFPRENYVGPILARLKTPLTERVKDHIERRGTSIFFSMGSSGNRDLFLEALEALDGTEHNVVAAYTSILEEGDLPAVSDNVLLEKVVPAEVVTKVVDLSVIHGGQGTAYTAAYSGKPAVGIPMQFEQQYNLDLLVRNGTTIRIAKERFRKRDLLHAVDKILANYDRYLANAKELAARLPETDGAMVAAQRLKEIVENDGLRGTGAAG